MSLNSTDRERNYVQARFPGLPRELAYGLKYLTGPQMRRIRHKQHRRQRRNETNRRT